VVESYRGLVSWGALVLQLGLSAVIIAKVAYTEIDWRAYMQEVEYVLDGEMNYVNIKGDTGPLVYPGGFVWLFIALRAATSGGVDILTGQYIFAAILLLLLAVVLGIYHTQTRTPTSTPPTATTRTTRSSSSSRSRSRSSSSSSSSSTTTAGGNAGASLHHVPAWALVLLVLSKRIHSIFVLRLFNDCIAVLLGYVAVYLFAQHRFRAGSAAYSLGISIKMNLFLMAPGVLLVLWLGCGLQETVICLALCALVQVLLGLPFLTTYPVEYLSRAFEFSRVFKHEWTVNLKFLDEATFVSRPVSLALLLCTVLAFLFFARKWLSENASALHSRGFQWWRLSERGLGKDMSPAFIVTTIFASNFVGVAFARTLHYQFYCWYFHTLPWLLWHAHMPTALRLVCMVLIEVAFNVFPATPMSSAGLQVTAATPGTAHHSSARPVAMPTNTIPPPTPLQHTNTNTLTYLLAPLTRRWLTPCS